MDAGPKAYPWLRWQVPSQNETISLADQSSVCPLLGFPCLESSWLGKQSCTGRQTIEEWSWGLQRYWGCCWALLLLVESHKQPGRQDPACADPPWGQHPRSAAHSQEEASTEQNCLQSPCWYHQPPKAVSAFSKCLEKGVSWKFVCVIRKTNTPGGNNQPQL